MSVQADDGLDVNVFPAVDVGVSKQILGRGFGDDGLAPDGHPATLLSTNVSHVDIYPLLSG